MTMKSALAKAWPSGARHYRKWRAGKIYNLAMKGRVIADPVEYLVCESSRVVYVNNAKAACSSIKAQLLQIERPGLSIASGFDGRDVHELAWDSDAYGVVPPPGDDWFYFTFVRDPFARFVSFYKDKIKAQRGAGVYLSRLFDPHMTFAEVARKVSDIPDAAADRHFKAQAYLAFSEAKACDFVGKVETFDADACRLQSYIDLGDIQMLNRTTPSDYASFYDKETFQLVSRRYHEDIVRFGYEGQMNALKQRIGGDSSSI